MPRRQKADARLGDIKHKFLERCDELWGLHESCFMELLDEAESRKFNVTFVAALDFSESTAKLETSIRFSQVVKDKKQDDFDDFHAPLLPGTEDGYKERKEPKPKAKRKKKAIFKPGEDLPEEPVLSGKDAAAGERAA